MSDTPKQQPKKAQKTIMDSHEVVFWLNKMLKNKDYKKKLPNPRFTLQEFHFIRDLIFRKTKGLLFFYLADHLMNNTPIKDLPMFNAPSAKKLKFIHSFFDGKGGAHAARKAGFSPRTAKQQAWRILREINGYKRHVG